MSVVDQPAYERFQVGDEVWCLAWLGMPFVVTGKDEATQTIEIDGTGPCSLPEGALLDLAPQNHFMLTHEHWDQIWYWPDSAGERYLDVVDRFLATHHDGQIVTGYTAGMMTVVDEPDRAASYRVRLAGYDRFGQITAEPVAAIADGGSSLLRVYDPAIPADRWIRSGPNQPVEIKMVAYRWALACGKVVLNWSDFD